MPANYFQSAIAFALIILLTGCAAPPVNVNPSKAATLKRVAPISAVADSFTRKYVGLTVFGNEKEELPIADWEIDSAYEEQLALEIQRTLGATAIRATYPVSEFAHVNDLNGPYYAPAFWGPNWTKIEGAALAYCSANSLDALLVVAKRTSEDFVARTNQHISGAGIYSRGPVNNVSVLHVLAQVGLIDCATGKPIAIRPLTWGADASSGTVRPLFPLAPIPHEVARLPIGQWSAEIRDRIRNDLIAAPRRAWAWTIDGMLTSR